MAELDKFFADREVKGSEPAPAAAPAEVVLEPVPASTPEPMVASAPPVSTPEPAAPSFDINSFNTFFGTSLKEEAELKNALKRATEYGDVQKKYEETEAIRKSLEEKNKELQSGTDPLKYFSSPDAYIAEQIRIQRPDVDPGVVTRLLSHDKQKLADFDLLVYDHLMLHPETIDGAEGARELVAKKYDVDVEESPEKWDRVSRNLIMADARTAERRIAQLKSEIKLPQAATPEVIEAQRAEATQKMKAAWAPYVNEISTFDKLVVPGDDGATLLEMEVPKAFRDTLPEYVNGVIEQTGLEPKPENLKEIIDYRNRMFVYEYLPKILEVYGNNIRSELEKAKHELLNNTTPPNTATAPPPLGSEKNAGARAFISESTKRRW